MRFIVSAAIRLWCHWTVFRRLQIDMEGAEHIPKKGPVLIVSRHYHHLYDGVIYLSAVRRTVSILVALDWVPNRRIRSMMEFACRMAGWPAVLREDRLRPQIDSDDLAGSSAYALNEAQGYLRRAMRQSVTLLRRGKILIVFPEAYPKIDPMPNPRNPDLQFLPFRRGFAHLVRNAQRDGSTLVRVVPAGLWYEGSNPWRAHVRFGSAHVFEEGQSLDQFAVEIETLVHELSGPQELHRSPDGSRSH